MQEQKIMELKISRHFNQSRAYYRNMANLRERKRMLLINEAFDKLKDKLPLEDLIQNNNLAKQNKLTKVEILKLSVFYIKYLSGLLHKDHKDCSNETVDETIFVDQKQEIAIYEEQAAIVSTQKLRQKAAKSISNINLENKIQNSQDISVFPKSNSIENQTSRIRELRFKSYLISLSSKKYCSNVSERKQYGKLWTPIRFEQKSS